MKKLLILFAALLLLLTACAGGETEATLPATQPEETTPPGLYVPGSAAEKETAGAVRQYALNGSYWGISTLPERVILFSGEEKTELSVLTGETGVPGAVLALPLDVRQGGFQPVNGGLAYYDKGQNRGIYLDGDLQCYRAVELPSEIQGLPVFSADGGEIYLCAEQELRGLDTQRGLSRLIKTFTDTPQGLGLSVLGGSVVSCTVELGEGAKELRYISTENGATVSTDTGIQSLASFENTFFLRRMDGTVLQYIYGTEGETPLQLNAPQSRLEPALEVGGAVAIESDGEKLTLQFYALESGAVTASVTIPEKGVVQAVCGDRRGGWVWVLTDSGSLYRWDVKASAVASDVSVSGPVYTRSAPDTEGLSALQSRVDQLNKTHGVSIRIAEKALSVTNGHTLESEYQTAAISKILDEMEAVLGKFPESFLRKSVIKNIRICIVRSVDGAVKTERFLYKGDTYILVSCGTEVEKDFLSAMGYVVDVHTLSNSPMLDDWSKLNPEGFEYGEAADKSLAEGENRAFADEASMVSVSEERARLFNYAVTDGNEGLFQSPVMQEKLLLLCRAIRDAWGLERKADTYLWEQYLEEAIAYR